MQKSIDVRVAFVFLMAAALAGYGAFFHRSKASAGLQSRHEEMNEISTSE